MPRGRKKQNVLTLEEQLVTVNERIQEVENELKQLRSQRKEIQAKLAFKNYYGILWKNSENIVWIVISSNGCN